MLKKEKNISFVPAETRRINRSVTELTRELISVPLHSLRKRPERLISANARGAIKFLTATGPTIHCNVISIFALMPN